MKDIVPELLEKIQKSFDQKVSTDETISAFLKKVEKGTATMEELSLYGRKLGDHLAESLLENITLETLPDSRLYFNIANRILDPTMHNNYDLVNSAAAAVQKSIDKANGIGLNTVKATYPEERVMAVINGLSDKTATWETIRSRMDEPVRNISQSFVDDFMMVNAAFRSKAGLKTHIVRSTFGKCCEWCEQLAGSYSYPEDVPRDVFKRHDNCRCTVVLKSEKGSQNVWSKKWQDPDEDVTLFSRKLIGLRNGNTTINEVSDHVLVRIHERDLDVEDIADAINRPLKTTKIKIDEQGRKSYRAIGEKATVVINPETGNVSTAWRTSRKLSAKLKKGK